MAGALIVDGDFADVPEIAAARDRVLIVNEVIFDYLGAIESYDTVWPEAVPRFLAVNGQREPIVRLRPGEVQRWRIVQAAHESNFQSASARGASGKPSSSIKRACEDMKRGEQRHVEAAIRQGIDPNTIDGVAFATPIAGSEHFAHQP